MKNTFAYGLVVYKVIDSQIVYLLLKSVNTQEWGFPKGHVDSTDNSKIQTALRETFEETSLSDLALDYSSSFNLVYFVNKNTTQKHVGYFPAKLLSGEVELSDEHSDFIWKDLQSSLSLIKHENLKELLINVDSKMRLFNGLQ